jgi:hypothetical protein
MSDTKQAWSEVARLLPAEGPGLSAPVLDRP